VNNRGAGTVIIKEVYKGVDIRNGLEGEGFPVISRFKLLLSLN